jgi:hypothetical protein
VNHWWRKDGQPVAVAEVFDPHRVENITKQTLCQRRFLYVPQSGRLVPSRGSEGVARIYQEVQIGN